MTQVGQEGKQADLEATPVWAQGLQTQLQHVDEHLVDLNEALLMLVAVQHTAANASEGAEPGQEKALLTAESGALAQLLSSWEQVQRQLQLLVERTGVLLSRLEQVGQRLEAAETALRTVVVAAQQPPRAAGRSTAWPATTAAPARQPEAEGKVRPIRPALPPSGNRAPTPLPSTPVSSPSASSSPTRRLASPMRPAERGRDATEAPVSASLPRPRWRWW